MNITIDISEAEIRDALARKIRAAIANSIPSADKIIEAELKIQLPDNLPVLKELIQEQLNLEIRRRLKKIQLNLNS